MEDSSFSDKAEEPLIYGLRDSTTIRLSATGQSKPQHFLAYKDIFFTLLFLGNLLFVGAIAISYGGVAMASAGADYWIVDLNGHEALDKATHHITSKLMMGVLLALTIGGVLSMSWIYFLSKVASFVMNTMIMSIVGICAIGGVFVLGMGYPYLGFLLILVALLTLILSLVFQARIEFASMNLKVACEGIVAIPTTISYSLKMLFLQAIFVTIWCIATYGFATNAYKVSKSFGGHTYNLDECTSYKYSTAFEVDGLSLTCASTTGSPCYACLCGDDNELISTNACFKPRFYWTAMVFLVLSLFWATAVIANVVHCTTAAAISHWWRQGKCDDDTVAEGFRRVTSYSFGSICFGSLLAAIIRTIRSILVFLNGKMRRREEYRQSSTMMERMNSCAARVLMNLLHILDRMIVYFNRYAFVFVAIEGQDYMQASSTAVQLFKSRGFATLLNDDIIDLLIHISTVMIGLLTMILAYMYCKAVVLSHAYSYLLAIFSFFCGYVMSTVLLSTMSSAVTTVYVSFAKNPREFENSNPLLYGPLAESWCKIYPHCLEQDANRKMEDQFNGDFDDKPTPGSSQKIRGSYQPPSVSTAMPTTSTSSESNGGESSVESIKTKSVSWANTMLQMVSLSPTPLDSSSSRGKVVKGGYERLPTELTDSDMELGKSSQFLSTNNNTSSNLSSSNNPVVSRVTNLTNFIRDTLAKEDDDSQL